MNVRLRAAVAIVEPAAVALVALRFVSGSPTVTSTTRRIARVFRQGAWRIPRERPATIFIGGPVARAKAFESQRRVRLYGIHFDVASAKIQTISEATIAQIAQVLSALGSFYAGHLDEYFRAFSGETKRARRNRTFTARRSQSIVQTTLLSEAKVRVRS